MYILRCADGSLYTGITTDLKRRLAQHHNRKGSKAIRGRLPARLVFRELHKTRGSALKREHQIKSWPRSQKLSLLHG